MDSKPLVSIIINNYNYARFLSNAIDSALGQTYSNIEVIVVDDGSTDNSHEIIQSYGRKIIALIKENSGQASALNAGFAVSKGQIICILDSDDLYLPQKIVEVVDSFQSHPNIDWVFHESVPLSSEEIVNWKITNKNIGNLDSESLPKNIDFRKNILNGDLPDFTPSTSNLCFSRKLLDKLFPLPEIKGMSGMAITDLYIKYLAVGLSTGSVMNKNLGIFRIHNNTYSNPEISITRKRNIYSEIHIVTAYWMLFNFPDFGKLSKKLFSKGLATYLRSRNDKFNCESSIKAYLSAISTEEKIEISWKTFYYFIKLSFVSVV